MAERHGAADRVADQDRTRHARRGEKPLQQARIADGAGRDVIVARVPLPRPVERQHAIPVAQAPTQAHEVRGAMADGVKADHVGAGALLVERQAHPVDRHPMAGGAEGRSCAMGRLLEVRCH